MRAHQSSRSQKWPLFDRKLALPLEFRQGRDMFERGKTGLEKRRIETLSSITGERVDVEAMAQRPRNATDTIDNALLERVLKRLAEIEAAARKRRALTTLMT